MSGWGNCIEYLDFARYVVDHVGQTHTGAKDALNVEGCAKSFAMFCFDFLR